jgi:RNA polymerase sigma-70 factor (ECF subfamily)
MAHNLIHDHVRTAMRRSNREKVWGDMTGAGSGRDEMPLADRTLVARQRLGQVETTLGTLAARTQSIFRDSRIDGHSLGQIARAEGISVSAVEKHLQRARRILMTLPDEYGASPINEGDAEPHLSDEMVG